MKFYRIVVPKRRIPAWKTVVLPADLYEEPPADACNRRGTAAATALILALTLLMSVGALASLPSAGEGNEPVAILFPFWIGKADAVARSFEAGERVLRSGRFSAIVVVAPRQNSGTLPRGAWLSLKLAGLAGCLDNASVPGEPQ